MVWEYKPLPDALLLPPCPRCANRGHVTMILRGLFVCTDCQPAHPFVAIWRPEQRQALPEQGWRAG